MFSASQGKKLVSLARKTIDSVLVGKKLKLKSQLKEKRGIFVSVYSYPKKQLKGCIGFIEPLMELGKAVPKLALEAAFKDFRFKPLTKKDKGKYTIELSILTQPKLIEVKDTVEYLEKIRIGHDGLVVELRWFKSVLLPHVAAEHKWTPEQFLNHACVKAGLTPFIWRDPRCRVYAFQTQIFEEKSPDGKVVEKAA